MVRMINCWTNTEMLVADDRVDEYKAAGCILAAKAEKPTVEAPTEKVDVPKEKVEPKKAEPKKTTRKVTARKK